MTNWEESVDFVVMGSGAAGMSAAIRAHDLGLKVVLVEKTAQFGGNTAMSGGVCWVPNNPGMPRVGISDSDDESLTYLKHITQGEVAEDRLKLYIGESKRVLAYLEANAHLHYEPLAKYTDYYPEAPGGKPGGRSMDPQPYDGAKLGGQLMMLRPPHPQSQVIGKFGITAADAHNALGLGLKTMLFMAWQLFRYGLRYFKRKRWGRDTKLCAGNSLMGRLLRGALDRQLDLRLNTSVKSLVIEAGQVRGVVLEQAGQLRRVEARKGVLIAAGGFARSQAMRDKYLPKPIKAEWTAGSPANTGDGIQLGMEAGGQVAFMDEAWWTPVAMVPKSDVAWVLVVEKSLPHGIFVNMHGQRFTNEAAPYIDVVHGMFADAKNAGVAEPRWFHIFDADYRRNSVTGPIAPGKLMPDAQLPRRYRDGKYLHKAATLEQLANDLGIDARNLQHTIDQFNEASRKGEDPAFGRGKSVQDRYYGRPDVKPNCALGPVSKAPFYAVEIFPGDLGTKGGLVTDASARVLDHDGQAIVGLYAAGNASAPVMGRTYPGAGGTIGPALTFGFLAAEHAAEAGTNKLSGAANAAA